MEMSVPLARGSKVKRQTTEYCVQVIVSGRLTQTWLRYSDLRSFSQTMKSIKGSIFAIWGTTQSVFIGRPRLGHFPSRITDNRSSTGVENRRVALDNYFKSISGWNLYPKIIEKFISVKIPETMLMETYEAKQSDFQHEAHDLTNSRLSTISTFSLFYRGDQYFNDMENDHIDAIVDEIYNWNSLSSTTNSHPITSFI